MIELSEQTIIDEVVDRLAGRYPAVPRADVRAVVRDIHASFDGRPLRDFVPLLVERNARRRLEGMTAMAD